MDHTTTSAMIAAMHLTRAKEYMNGEINEAFDLMAAIIDRQASRGMPWAYFNVPEAFTNPVFKIEW